MSTEAATRLLTAEEFFELPEPITGGKMELIRGEVVTHMPVGGVHGEIAGTAYTYLSLFGRSHNLGRSGVEIGFVLQRDPDVVVAPDAAFISIEKLPGGVLPEGFIEGAPTLAVEVVSPGDREQDVAEKIGQYLAFGTKRAWVVRPRLKTVTVHHPDGISRTLHVGETLTSDDAGFPVDGFALPLAELFA